ncbi:ATP-binding cassette sub-family A member 5-like [Patiria miniata]|uniref:ABC transporter domain-containing protein n=1 Tax=Patiria miniata TaxID=46514 RepID=A0A914AMF3_PATMI|nr:ATP-binding cassette sub-family A member 5-like [Patiria miniata]
MDLLPPPSPYPPLFELIVPCVFILVILIFKQELEYSETYYGQKYDQFISYKILDGAYHDGYKFVPDYYDPFAFAPNTSETRAVMDTLISTLNAIEDKGYDIPAPLGYDSENALVDAYNLDCQYTYESSWIHFHLSTVGESIWQTRNLSRPEPPSDPPRIRYCNTNQYLITGFAAIQIGLQHAVASVVTGETLPVPDFWVRMLPTEGVKVSSTSYVDIINVFFYVLMYAIFITVLMTNLVYEKEKKIKETMLMMGMSNAAFWLAWFIIYSVILLLVSLVITVLSKYALKTTENSDFFLIFLVLFFYGMSLVSMAFMLTPFFNKSVVAGAVATIATILLGAVYIPIGFVTNDGVSFDAVYRFLLSFFSPLAVAFAMDQTIFFELQGPGLQFDNVLTGLGGFPPYIAMLVIDMVLYLLLAIYFDNVIPGNYGQQKPPWFCFMPSYWCGNPKNGVASNDVESIEMHSQADVEPVSSEMRASAGIRIRNLSKTFHRGGKEQDVFAVREMSLDVYEGQITCLLGHNGAGKTTLINTLTGLITADNGQATICGYSIRDPIQMQKIRSMMGVCPQDNTLFDVLSAREHLQVYAGLKGVPRRDIKAEVDKILKLTMLDESANTKSKDLSGGQKRKLCVGIALIGDPKILFLDEPSSGMDPYSRRQMWSLLKNQRQGRIVVLTTHFMDEADILADRKAVMSRGRLRCYGSSLFLKSRFGVGYHLGMVVEQNAHVDSVTDLVMEHVPNSQVSRSHGMELSYTLPLQEAHRFQDLFKALENHTSKSDQSVAKELGIQSYGVSMTTLEEVFLKLNDEEDVDERDMTNSVSDLDSPKGRVNGVESRTLDVEATITQPLQPGSYQIQALCKVQFLQMWRNPRTYVVRLLLPIILMVVSAVLVATVSLDYVNTGETPPVTIDPKMYVEKTSGYQSDRVNPLLYVDNLTAPEDVSVLTKEFGRMGLRISDELDDLSKVMSVAPHNLATVPTNLGTSGATPKLLVAYNGTAIHSIPVMISILGNALNNILTTSTRILDMTFVNHPLPTEAYSYRHMNAGVFMVAFIPIGLTLLPSGFLTNIVRERQEKIRTQLRVSGVSMFSYWLSHFLIDSAQMFLMIIVAIIISLITGFSTGGMALSTGGGMAAFILFAIPWVPLSVLFSYCLSFMFSEVRTSQIVAQILYIFLPVALVVAALFVDLLPKPNGDYNPDIPHPDASLMHQIFSFFYPPYTIFGLLYFSDKVYQTAYKKEEVDKLQFGVFFEMINNVLPAILCTLGSLVVVICLLRVLEVMSTGGRLIDAIMFWAKPKPEHLPQNDDFIEDEDSDVKAERDKVRGIFHQSSFRSPNHAQTAGNCVVAASSIRKVFHKRRCCCRPGEDKVAVRNLSLSVNEGQVLGLLGPNGAGKTTSMNVITADTKPARGQIQIAGHDLASSLTEAFRVIGYCPQHDPLYENLTVREHLEAYALIKGVHPTDAKAVAKSFMDAVGISEHAKKKAKELSGGTKRKLCFAISMLGKPKIVFLDEPSTGMDPSSKRFVWNIIISSFRGDQGAILTTHSMEEADAVCSRVGIMVLGKLMCLGTTQHLKGKYGRGYSLEVKLNPGPAYYSMDHTSGQAVQLLEGLLASLDNQIRKVFPSAEVMESFGERVTYKIPSRDVKSLSTVFAVLEQGKESLNIEEYSFSQASLEQVFLEFARMQSGEDQNISPTHHAGMTSPTHHAGMTNSAFDLGENSHPVNMQPNWPTEPPPYSAAVEV